MINWALVPLVSDRIHPALMHNHIRLEQLASGMLQSLAGPDCKLTMVPYLVR